MPQRKKSEPIADATPEPAEEETKPTPIRGYRPPSRWVRKTAPPELQPLEEDIDPFWIECNVSGVTNNDIDWLLNGDGLTWFDVWAFLAPRIRGWNALAYESSSQSYVVAPVPSETGVDAFNIVGADVSALARLLFVLAVRTGGDDRPFLSAAPA